MESKEQTKTRHTTGPWKIRENSEASGDPGNWGIAIVGSPRLDIRVFSFGVEEQAKVDARLIAAAPELLEACQVASKFIQASGTGPTYIARVMELQQAIDKAQGGTP